MEKKAKGIAWVGNLYQKFEAMCMEVDDMVCQETLRYVENQLQTVGSNVKQFCTELMQDLVASSTDSLEDLNTVQIAGVAASVDSNGSANEDHSQTKLVDSSSLKSVEDVHLGLPSEQITEDQNSLAHSKGFTAPGSLIFSKAFKNELNDNDSTADDTLLESMEPEVKMGPARLLEAYHKSVLKMEPEDRCELLSVSNNVGKHRSYKKKLRDAFSSKSRFTKWDDEQHALSRQMQDLVASSTDSLEDLNTVQIAGVAASVDSNGSANEDHSQTKLVDSSSVKFVEDVHLGLPSEQITEDQNSLAHSKGFTAPGSLIFSKAFKNEVKDNDSTADDTLLESMEPAVKMGPARLLEAYHKSVLKMEPEDRCELLSVSNNVGKHRSYKKKLRDAFSSKSRLTKWDDEQHAVSRQRNKRESQDMEFCESDWEII